MNDVRRRTLDDADALAGADPILRRLAEAGSRVRRETAYADGPLDRFRGQPRPRAMIAAGSEARLIRAMLEPVCPVPFVAWPRHGLPGWVGALDLVVVMASDAPPAWSRPSTRPCAAAPCCSSPAPPPPAWPSTRRLLDDPAADRHRGPAGRRGRRTVALHRMGLGPAVNPERSRHDGRGRPRLLAFADVAENPAKDLALCLADAQPLVWGGSVLAARASRRVAEALRAASGRVVLAADADALLPIIEATTARDPFADPFTDGLCADRRPCLVLLDDGNPTRWSGPTRAASSPPPSAPTSGCRVVQHRPGDDVDRYAALLQTGMFAAVYLGVGLGRG